MRNLIFLAVAALIGGLRAEEPSLRLQDLVDEALRRNPEVLAAQKRYESARQRPGRESGLPDPMLSLGYSSNGSPRPFAGLGREPTSNAGFMVTQDVPFPGKRKLRGDIASKDAQAELEQYGQTLLSITARVKQAWHRLHHSYEVIDLMGRSRDLLRRMLRVTEERYAVGRAMQPELFRLQTQLSVMQVRIEKMEQDKRIQQAEINALAVRGAGAPLGRPVAPPAGELLATLDELFKAARADSPLLRREQKMIERTELSVNLARKEYYPDYTLSAGYFNMGAMPDMFQFRVDFRLPVYFWRKQRAGVAEQSHTLAQARRSREATELSLEARIEADYRMAESSTRLMKMYTTTVIPQSKLTLESALAGYETGGGDFASLLASLMAVVEYETNFHEEMLNFHLARARLEETTGLSLDSVR